jgi:hypothetical protein
MTIVDESDPAVLRALQADIYREKVLRARRMTVSERLASAFECTKLGLGFMFAGVRAQQPGISDEETWKVVGARLDRARRLHDHGFYRNVEDGE